MNHGEGIFTGLHGTALFHQHWLPEGDPQAILLVAHGYGEHSSRYGNLVGHFVPLGYALYALDHRGHGRSGGERVHVEQFSDYVDDLKTYFDAVRAEWPALPVYLVGHSMGCFIAIAYAARFQYELAGLILSGGGIAAPGRAQPTRPPVLDLPATLSRDPAVVEAYRSDPLVFHGTPPASRAGAMVRLREELPSMAAAITLPVLIMAGDASPLGEGPGSQVLYETVSSKDKTLRRYEGLMHEIFNEPEHPTVLADMEAWLHAHR